MICIEGIVQGTFVCEYAGEIISPELALSRAKCDANNYILHVFEHSQTGKKITVIDPTKIGNIGRYLNHSCDPNFSLECVYDRNLSTPRVSLFANQDISAFQELTFDYGSSSSEDHPSSEVLKKKCFCGAEKCRGFLPFHQIIK